MTEVNTNNDKGDDSQIDINNQSDVYYWTKTLDVNAETLKKIVAAVGPVVADVKKNLGYKDKPSSGDIIDTLGEGFGSLPL